MHETSEISPYALAITTLGNAGGSTNSYKFCDAITMNDYSAVPSVVHLPVFLSSGLRSEVYRNLTVVSLAKLTLS